MVAWDKLERNSMLNLSNYLLIESSPKCHNYWCTSGLPPEHHIPIRINVNDSSSSPESDPDPVFQMVCDECYHDYAVEGIESIL